MTKKVRTAETLRADKKTRGKFSKSSLSPVTSVLTRTRKIKDLTRLLLFVRAGGRCQFDGCNKYLLRHHLTLTEGNFAQIAHIVAFKPEGPRGFSEPRPGDINNIQNLMLLCPQCHKLIDDNPDRYTRKTLAEYKNRHEKRIFHVTGLGPDLKTTIVQLKANIGGQAVAIPASQVTEAVAPRYPTDLQGFVIDLTNIHGDDNAFLQTAMQNIKREVERLYAPGMEIEKTRHISLFAMAPIPLLIYLGHQLGNKIPMDLYQRHRDTEDWRWKKTSRPVTYETRLLQTGTDRSKVGLLLSLSGTIPRKDLPSNIDGSFYLYQIILAGTTPSPTFLRTREDLMRFKDSYQVALRLIMRDHGILRCIHLFPAVPAPIAVLCGRELLPKVDPKLIIYDYNKAKGGFSFALEVN
jgi:hypothetical protein